MKIGFKFLSSDWSVLSSPKRHYWHPIYDVLKTSDLRRLQEVWKSGLRRPKDFWITLPWRHPIFDVLKMPHLRRLQDVWFTTSRRRPIYVILKASNLRRLENVWFTTSWTRLTYGVLKMSVKWRLFSNVILTSIQRGKKWFFLKCSIWVSI